MATRADVAKLAGVSPSTVSYVLSGARPISEQTQSRVLAAMSELGYQPNALAAGLAGGRSPVIALHVPISGRPVKESDVDYLIGASATATSRGRMVMLLAAPADDPDAIKQLVSTGLVGGMLLMEVGLVDPRVDYLRQTDVPFALIGRTADPAGLAWADRDFDEVARMAVDHLVSLGHRHLAFLDGPASRREQGYGPSVRASAAALAAASAAGVGMTIIEAELNVEAGHQVMTRLRSRYRHVTGVLAFNDEATMGLFQQASTLGLSIPADLSVVSMSLSQQRAAFFHPGITTISPPAADIAASATNQLMAAMGLADRAQQPQLWPGELVVRESTSRPPLEQ